MTHTPPVPAGNQSPYPLQEPPHKATGKAPPSDSPRVARTPEPQAVPAPTLLAVAAGIGLAAIAGGLFYAFGGKPEKSKKRKPARRKAGTSER